MPQPEVAWRPFIKVSKVSAIASSIAIQELHKPNRAPTLILPRSAVMSARMQAYPSNPNGTLDV
jgi:hypothetical protein